MLVVKTCCYCSPLRNGVSSVLIYFLLTQITSIWSVMNRPTSNEVVRIVTLGSSIIMLSFAVLGLIGLFMKIPSLLILAMIMLWIAILKYIFDMIYVIISPNDEAYFRFANFLSEKIARKNEDAFVIFFVEYVSLFYVVFWFYLFIVTLSYYKEMREDLSKSPSSVGQDEASTKIPSTLSSSPNTSLHSSFPSAYFAIMQEI